VFVVAFTPVGHGYQCRRIDVGDIDPSHADFEGRTHAAVNIAVDADTQGHRPRIPLARCERNMELGRQLIGAFTEQPGRELEGGNSPYLRRRELS
jgi:hypothetical protein